MLLVILIGLLALLALFVWSIMGSRVEQPQYTVVTAHNAIEIRDYPSLIVAEVETSGEREAAINQGFHLLAKYIFGGNTSQTKVAMTAPVTQQLNEKIAMTAPVTQQSSESGKWKVHFTMPAKYTLASLPEPNNALVQLKEVAAKRYAVIRFSGFATQTKINKQQQLLESFIQQQDLEPIAKPIYAFYNPPWTLPFLRRNEVMIEIARQ